MIVTTKKLTTYKVLIAQRKAMYVTYRNGIFNRLDFGTNVLTEQGVDALFGIFPITEPTPVSLKRLFTDRYDLEVEVVVTEFDTGFEAFWEAYNYKVGTKTRAEKQWAGLNRADRIAAIEWIAAYEAERPSYQAKLHPESYITQKRWLT